jgi:hypothetical protein
MASGGEPEMALEDGPGLVKNDGYIIYGILLAG